MGIIKKIPRSQSTKSKKKVSSKNKVSGQVFKKVRLKTKVKGRDEHKVKGKQPLWRLLLLSVFFVITLPVIFLFISQQQNHWNGSQQQAMQKHQLMAQSMVEPIRLYFQNQQLALASLTTELRTAGLNKTITNRTLMQDFINKNREIVALVMVPVDHGNTVAVSQNPVKADPNTLEYVVSEKNYRKYNKENSVSSVIKSTFSRNSVVLVRHQIFDSANHKLGILIAEVGLQYIQKLCSQIAFGKSGQCALVDDSNALVAHPNSAWVSQQKNFSQHEFVKKLKSVTRGTGEYFSKQENTQVLGAYAKVDDLGWGVLITQAANEVNTPLEKIKLLSLAWVAGGSLLALLFAYVAIRKILQPLNKLVDQAKELDLNSDKYKLEEVPKASSEEVSVLWNFLATLISSYRDVNAEVQSLSGASKKDMRKVISDLRQKNLKNPANQDPQTGITTRDCFIREMKKMLMLNKGDNVGLILLDVDDYQSLDAHNGAGAGQSVAKHIAATLRDNVRSGDMIMRNNDHAQFAIYIDNCNLKSLRGTAMKLSKLIESTPAILHDESIYISLSIGIVLYEIDNKLSVETLMKSAAQALQQSQSDSRNKISSYQSVSKVA